MHELESIADFHTYSRGKGIAVKYLNVLLIVWVFALNSCRGQLINIPLASMWAPLRLCLKEISAL